MILGLVPNLVDAQGIEGWNDLKISAVNKLAPHVNVIPVKSSQSCNRLCLNGEWHLAYFEKPSAVSDDVVSVSYPLSSLGVIQVPGNMELQGYGIPVYVNTTNEFKSNPPYPPVAFNPVGVYLKDVEVPQSWLNERVVIKFGAVKSALALYINGEYVGYSEDSKTPAEFEIGRYLHQGKNRIAAKVYRWCDGSYLECQDMWRMSGITRDVELYATSHNYIEDYTIVTHIMGANIAEVEASVSVVANGQFVVEGSLIDELGNVVAYDTYQCQENDSCKTVDLSFTLQNAQEWCPENPYLYTLVLKMIDANNTLTELHSKVGVREVSIVDGLLCLNGKPITIKGVNRHEHDGRTGHYVSRESMEKDIQMMKDLGINAVRTCHYPDDEYWYDLCDKYGIMVWDEANNESHAQGYGEGSLAKNDSWSESIMNRCNNMVCRDKNHPSVIVWSLGNECGNGVCFEKAYEFVKKADPTRPVSYERAELDWNTDIVGIMYPSVDYISSYARGLLEDQDKRTTTYRRPYIMVEYCHAMGNSMGGLSDYWDTINKYPILQGGFVWDWVDQSFYIDSSFRANAPHLKYPTNKNGWFAVGGDLGTIPDAGNDDAFCANGVVNSLRKPHPHAAELKAVYKGLTGDSVTINDVNTYANQVPARISPSIKKTNGLISIDNKVNTIIIDPNTGNIISWRIEKEELLSQPIRWNFWRAPTLNDLVDGNGAKAWDGLDNLKITHAKYKLKGQTLEMVFFLSDSENHEMLLRELVEVDDFMNLQLSFHLEPLGSFRTLPKMGIQFGIDSTSYKQVHYLGNKYETYPDRRKAQCVGEWNETPQELSEMTHVVPQEYGNHEAQWVSFEGDKHTLWVGAPKDTILNFSIKACDDSELTRARRLYELTKDDYYVVNIDHKVAGIGTATCGPGVRKPYQISGDSVYDYRFILVAGTTKMVQQLANCELFAPNKVASQPIAHPKKQLNIKSIKTKEPSTSYNENFPQALYDGKPAICGNYHSGWVGYEGDSNLVIDVELNHRMAISEIMVGFCHHANDWVLAPDKVELQVSSNGKVYSTPITLKNYNELSNFKVDAKRVVMGQKFAFFRCRMVSHIRLTIHHSGVLPSWHDFAGKNAWLMIDEITVKTK